MRLKGGWRAKWGEAESQAEARGITAATWNSQGPCVQRSNQSGPASHPPPGPQPGTPWREEAPGWAVPGRGQGTRRFESGARVRELLAPLLGGAAGASGLGLNREHKPESIFPSWAPERPPAR